MTDISPRYSGAQTWTAWHRCSPDFWGRPTLWSTLGPLQTTFRQVFDGSFAFIFQSHSCFLDPCLVHCPCIRDTKVWQSHELYHRLRRRCHDDTVTKSAEDVLETKQLVLQIWWPRQVDDWKWLEMTGNDWKWLEMTGNDWIVADFYRLYLSLAMDSGVQGGPLAKKPEVQPLIFASHRVSGSVWRRAVELAPSVTVMNKERDIFW